MITARACGDYLTSLGFTENNGKKNTVFNLSIEGQHVLSDRIRYPRHIVGHLRRGVFGGIARKLGLTEEEFLSGIRGELSNSAVLLCLCVQLTHESMREHLRDPIMNNEEEVETLLESVDRIRRSIVGKTNWKTVDQQVLSRKKSTLLQYQDHELSKSVVNDMLTLFPA